MRLLACLAAVAGLAAPASALTLVARVPAPRGPLVDVKLQQSADLACRALADCQAPLYVPDGADGGPGRVFFKGSGFRPELSETQKAGLVARISALWGESVAVSQDLPYVPSRAVTLERGFSKALPALLPPGLLDGSAAGAFYDRSASIFSAPPATFDQRWSALEDRPGRPAWPALMPSQEAAPAAAPAPPAVEAGDVPPGPYAKEIAAAAARYRLDAKILTAVVAAKSGFRANGGGGDAYGLMGVSRRSFRVLEGAKKDIHDPEANLDAGARMLSGLLKQFDGDIHRALAAYQAGPRAVLRSGGIPNSRAVRDFLADYEKAYRSGPQKPAVVPVPPPSPLRRLKDQAQETAARELDRAGRQPADAAGVARYLPLIQAAAKRVGVDPLLMEAMVMGESDGDPRAVSKKGAVGLGQLMPATARELGVKNPKDPAQNLRGMASHLDYLLDKYDDPVLAVAAYNAGEGRVDRAGLRVPGLRETQGYVRKVFDNYYELTGVKYEVDSKMAPLIRRRHKKTRAHGAHKSKPRLR